MPSFSAWAQIKGNFRVESEELEYFDRNRHNLRVVLYNDETVHDYEAALAAGTLCSERMQKGYAS